jgi:hypothetical protein
MGCFPGFGSGAIVFSAHLGEPDEKEPMTLKKEPISDNQDDEPKSDNQEETEDAEPEDAEAPLWQF